MRGEGKGTALDVSVMSHIARGEADGDLRCPTSFELFHQLVADFYRDRPFIPERLDDLKREREIQLFSTPFFKSQSGPELAPTCLVLKRFKIPSLLSGTTRPTSFSTSRFKRAV
jgi:hypothetical protein